MAPDSQTPPDSPANRHQRRSLSTPLAWLPAREKCEVAGRILQSIRSEAPADDRARQRHDALNRLCRAVDAMRAAEFSLAPTSNNQKEKGKRKKVKGASFRKSNTIPGPQPPIPRPLNRVPDPQSRGETPHHVETGRGPKACPPRAARPPRREIAPGGGWRQRRWR